MDYIISTIQDYGQWHYTKGYEGLWCVTSVLNAKHVSFDQFAVLGHFMVINSLESFNIFIHSSLIAHSQNFLSYF